MSVFFKKIKDEKEFQDFVKESMESYMFCAGCNIRTRGRAIYITSETPVRQILYGLCSKCQERCVKSKEFTKLISEKISTCIIAENN